MSATNRGSVRSEQDYYPTPKWCTEELLPLIHWDQINSFYEPCLGNGAIYDLIPLKDDQKQWSEITRGRDYLKDEVDPVDLIITNPPYSLAKEFIKKALSHSTTVIMLLRLNYLEAQVRYPFWQGNPPSHIITLSSRPSFTGKGTDATGYAWIVWNGENIVKGGCFQWIKNKTKKRVTK